MDQNLKPVLVRIATNVIKHNEALEALSKQKDVIEKKQHDAKVGTIDVLSKLLRLVQGQVQFAKEFSNLCQNWNPTTHPGDPVPESVSRCIRQWHRSFPGRVQQLTSLSTSLVESTKSYELAAKEFASSTQILHRDGVHVVESGMAKIKTDCVKEAQRLEQVYNNLTAARNSILQMKTGLERVMGLLQTRLDNHKPDDTGLGFSIAGGTTGLASLGLAAVCPPIGVAFGAVSLVSSLIGLGITESNISKSKRISRDADALTLRANELSSTAANFKSDYKKFVEDIEGVKLAVAAVCLLSEKFNPVKAAAEIMERTAIQRHSTSTSISLRVTGIQATSQTLEMVRSHDHIITCVEEILSDFSYSSKDDRVQKLDWEISTSNLPAAIQIPGKHNVKLEQIVLSQDDNNLIGTVAVQNLALNKSVTARYTFDNWKTMSDIEASYNDGLAWKGQVDGCDRFQFVINVARHQNLESKTMKICVRYKVNGNEYWDNNTYWNYKVKFKSQDLRLYKVIDKLVDGLDEFKVYEYAMQALGAIEDRDDYQEILKATNFEIFIGMISFRIMIVLFAVLIL